jgi:hypothetical protein
MNRNKRGSAAPKAAASANSRNGMAKKKKNGVQRQLKSAPVAQSRAFKGGQPRFVSSGSNGDVRIVHREYFSDLPGSVAFTATQYAINPGLSSMFPWLSQVAGRYETYHFNRLTFSYETESATSATGTVLLVVDTDAADAAPVSKSDALAYRIKDRGAPWEPFDLATPPLDDAGGMSRKTVRQGSLAANLDIKTYDAGNLFACTIGQAGTTVVGELYVDYDVSLYTPQVQAGSQLAALVSGTAGLTQAILFGTAPTSTGTLPFTINAAGDTMTFNTQCELILRLTVTGTVLSGTMANAGTCTFTGQTAVYNSGATTGIAPCLIRASPGQTFIPSIVATTVSAVNWRIGAYTYSLG